MKDIQTPKLDIDTCLSKRGITEHQTIKTEDGMTLGFVDLYTMDDSSDPILLSNQSKEIKQIFYVTVAVSPEIQAVKGLRTPMWLQQFHDMAEVAIFLEGLELGTRWNEQLRVMQAEVVNVLPMP